MRKCWCKNRYLDNSRFRVFFSAAAAAKVNLESQENFRTISFGHTPWSLMDLTQVIYCNLPRKLRCVYHFANLDNLLVDFFFVILERHSRFNWFQLCFKKKNETQMKPL